MNKKGQEKGEKHLYVSSLMASIGALLRADGFLFRRSPLPRTAIWPGSPFCPALRWQSCFIHSNFDSIVPDSKALSGLLSYHVTWLSWIWLKWIGWFLFGIGHWSGRPLQWLCACPRLYGFWFLWLWYPTGPYTENRDWKDCAFVVPLLSHSFLERYGVILLPHIF